MAQKTTANDTLQIALIGAGGMGQGDLRSALQIPGTEVVAVCDLYTGRLERSKEVWGKHLFTTRDYREVLARSDVDAVIVGTPDHWHSRISIDAMKAGKDVYCEKPMVQKVEQGMGVVEAQRETGRILQVGSQYVSNVVFEKARDLLKEGAIGELNMVEAWLDRNTALGAWQYTIPLDASPTTVDWDRFLGGAPQRPFDATRFFRWRNYQDYGTGVAGDLFVHLLSGVHFVTNSLGPERILATGGLRHWKDGRDVPDVMLAMLDYPKTAQHPEFSLALRVNLASGDLDDPFALRFIGTEGSLTTNTSTLQWSKEPKEREPGYSIGTFTKAMQEQYLAEYRKKYPAPAAAVSSMQREKKDEFTPSDGYNMHLEHHRNFHAAVRSRKPFLEDAVFGMRAAAPALLCNTSYFERRAAHWDPLKMVAS